MARAGDEPTGVGLFRHHPPCSSNPTVQRQYATRCEAGGDEPTGHKDEPGLPNSKALLEAQPFQSSPIQLHNIPFLLLGHPSHYRPNVLL